MRVKIVSKSEGLADKGRSTSAILGWPKRTRSDAAGVLVASWECEHCARVGEEMALSARRTAAPAATASVSVGGGGGPHGGKPGLAARPRHGGKPRWAARPRAAGSLAGRRTRRAGRPAGLRALYTAGRLAGQRAPARRAAWQSGAFPHGWHPGWAARPRHGTQPA